MKSILIIDDDPKISSALSIRFQSAGYTTLTAADAVTGLSQAVEKRPDLILLDLSLPGGNGIEVAQKLRELPQTRTVPFIFVTASRDPDLREKAMDLGAAGLFEKPYEADELLAVAGHALGETGMFRRPLPRFSKQQPETAGTAATGPAPTKRILIVEDDRKIAMALALRLRSAGYEAQVAADAITGVSTALRMNPDLVLLDISMPAGSGFTVAERIQTGLPSPVPMIFLTASKQPGFRERARELGAAGYFEKPYEAVDLLAAVEQEIGR